MNYPSTISLKSPLTLYRADSICPPNELVSTHKNPNYNTNNLGPKNKAGFFFFTDSIDIIKDTWVDKSKHFFYLTTCKVQKDIEFIDFSKCNHIHEMILLLKNFGVDILVDEFLTYEEKVGQNHIITFKSFEKIINDLKKNEIDKTIKFLKNLGIDINDEISPAYKKYITKLNNDHSAISNTKISCTFPDKVGILGQRLTDFDNGLIFRDKIKKVELDTNQVIDGYRFREDSDERGFTYCFFAPDKLTKISCEKMDLE